MSMFITCHGCGDDGGGRGDQWCGWLSDHLDIGHREDTLSASHPAFVPVLINPTQQRHKLPLSTETNTVITACVEVVSTSNYHLHTCQHPHTETYEPLNNTQLHKSMGTLIQLIL